ncbi:MAG: metalloregulator ArsR/SmtB family transcription factor [Xanthomonadales bacterium]|nr:metalloregulator ArsR/SmtB family transcription factor [Xanthomonadales bacterium]
MVVKALSGMDLQSASLHCRLLADSTRLRLLLILEQEELSVAELAAILQLAQPRISTHLAKLKEAGLVIDRREGVSVYYRMSGSLQNQSLEALWAVLRLSREDPLVQQDLERISPVLRSRSGTTWAESVAGDMDRHYSPGRTWEATSRALVNLLSPGRVLDIASGDGVMAELLAPHASAVICIDISEKVVAAGRQRLADRSNVEFKTGDMHQLPFKDKSFDTVLLMHALTYTDQPERVLREAYRVLKPAGQLLAVTLAKHRHKKAVEPYNHANLGFAPEQLRKLAEQSGLQVECCEVTAHEKRPPHFAVLTLSAQHP